MQLASGRLLLLGGWTTAGWGSSPAGDTTNEILYSDDNGKTWPVSLGDSRKPPTSGVGARFMPGHSAATFVATFGTTEYVYWIGTDALAGSARDGGVWRSSDGGTTWNRISTAAPTSDRSLFTWSVYRGAIYIMGGQDASRRPLDREERRLPLHR